MTLLIIGLLGTIAAFIFMSFFHSTNYETNKITYALKQYRIFSLLIFGLCFVCSTFTVISAGNIGVKTTLGKVDPVSLPAGFYFINPISDVQQISVRLDKASLESATASTKDLQVVHTDIVVNYRLEGADVANIYKNFGFDLKDKVLLPAINESFKAITARYNSEELITKRDIVSAAIKQELQDKVVKYGLSISEISLVNFGFSQEYQSAIEQKVIATQSKLKAEQDLQRIKVEAEQNIAKAQGEAESIRIQSAAIETSGGVNYVHLKAIEKWDGQLPTTVVGGDSMPFVNIPSVKK